MSTTILNNTPMVVFEGIQDLSVPKQLPNVENLPIHLPLVYIQAAWGDTKPELVMAGDFTRLYHEDSINPRLPYINHATVGLKLTLAEGNSCFVKRVVSETARKSSMTIVLNVDTTPGVINEYARDLNGTVIEDANGAPTFNAPAVPVVGGAKLKFSVVPTSAFEVEPGVFDFSSTGEPGTKSYPILTTEAPHYGVRGDRTGIQLWTASGKANFKADPDTIEQNQSLIFGSRLIEKALNNTPIVIENRYSASVHEFCFKPGAYSAKTNVDLNLNGLIDKWADDGVLDGLSPTYGPLGKIIFHSGNLDEILDQLLVIENDLAPTETTKWMLDFLTGIDVNGVHHYGFQIDKTGALFTEGRTYYLMEGNDGDLSLEAFDQLVANELDYGYEVSDYPLMNTARYNWSCIYDTGFTLPTKLKFFKWLGRRPDIYVTVGTFTAGEAPLTIEEEISIGTYLHSAASIYAESDVYGTPVVRAVIMAQSGQLIGDPYKERVGAICEIMAMRARYCGAAVGGMKPSFDYDSAPTNQSRLLYKLNYTYMTKTATNTAWSAGLNFLSDFDRRKTAYYGLQTVYSIKESVLTSEINMQIFVDVTKKCEQVWRELTGNVKLTKDQFIKRSNERLIELTAGLYDGRVVIIPDTHFTAIDSNRGYSWTLTVTIGANTMKTVETVNVVAKRIEQLGNILV